MLAITYLLAKDLVESGKVSSGDMDTALQHQVLFGGELDTTLLELDLVDEKTLTEALVRVTQLPMATAELLNARDSRVTKLLPARLARQYGVLPVAMRGRQLYVVSGSRLKQGAGEDVGFMLSLALRTHIVCEARFEGCMRDWMRVEIEPRFRMVLSRLGPYDLHEPVNEASALGAAPVVDPISEDLPVAVDNQDRVVEALARVEEEKRLEEAKREQLRTGHISAEEAAEACMHAEHRDDIVDLTLRFARQFIPYVGLFIVHGNNILGWDAVGTDDAGERIKQYRGSTRTPSVLSTVATTQAPYIGPVPETVEGNTELLLSLGRPEPENAVVLPIVVRKRIVGLLFGDARSKIIRGDRVGDLLTFVNRLPEAFEQLILRRKAQADEEIGQDMPTPVEQ